MLSEAKHLCSCFMCSAGWGELLGCFASLSMTGLHIRSDILTHAQSDSYLGFFISLQTAQPSI
jgi:hypothetical protein